MEIINYKILTPVLLTYIDKTEKTITIYLDFLNKKIIFTEDIENKEILESKIEKIFFQKNEVFIPKNIIKKIKNNE